MEQRIAPTSPKYSSNTEDSKPAGMQKSGMGVMGFLSVLFISVIGGAAGMLIVVTQGQSLGVSFFKEDGYVQQAVVSRLGNKQYQERQNILQKQRDEASNQVVFLYETQKETAPLGVLSATLWKGVCAILTSDGMCITPASVIGDIEVSELFALDKDGTQIAIKKIDIDAQASLAYVQLEKGVGATIDIADEQDPFPLDEVEVLVVDPNMAQATLQYASLQHFPYGQLTGQSGYVVSSDAVFSTVMLHGTATFSRGSLVLRPDGVAVGLFDGDAQHPEIRWLPERKSHIAAFLAERKLAYAALGVHGIDLDFAPQQKSSSSTKGFYLTKSPDGTQPAVTPKSPAALAGLREGDVITKWNKDEISFLHTLQKAMRNVSPEARVQLTILRDGKEQEISVTLGAL